MNKKSNLENLLTELFENEYSDRTEPNIFSVEASADPNLQSQNVHLYQGQKQEGWYPQIIASTVEMLKVDHICKLKTKAVPKWSPEALQF